MKYSQEQIEKFKKKADKWDALEKKIANFYPEDQSEDDADAGLVDIGEIAAEAFGFL